MQDRPLLRRSAGVILDPAIFDEEGRAEIRPDLTEQGATAS
jgi:hypothetical protein